MKTTASSPARSVPASIPAHTDLYRDAYAVHRRYHQRDSNAVAVSVVHCPACHYFVGAKLAAMLDYDAAAATRHTGSWYQDQIGAAICPLHRADEIREETIKVCDIWTAGFLEYGFEARDRVECDLAPYRRTSPIVARLLMSSVLGGAVTALVIHLLAKAVR